MQNNKINNNNNNKKTKLCKFTKTCRIVIVENFINSQYGYVKIYKSKKKNDVTSFK
jgi:hypothetical protein